MADGETRIPSVRIVKSHLTDCDLIARNMRDDEIEQFLALMDIATYDADVCATYLSRIAGPRWAMVGADGMPFLIGGFEPILSKTMRAWMAGTQEGWDKHWRSITKLTRRLMDEMLADGDIEVIEVIALASRNRACEWYERGLGMTFEGVRRRWLNGFDVSCYSKLKQRG